MTARPTLLPDAAAFAAQIPYAFAKSHGVLAAGVDGDAVVVLTRPDATPDGVVEIRRVLQRPLTTRAVSAEAFAAELARAYNQGAPSAAATWADDLARETDLTRLMQDLPAAEDLLDSSTQAPVIRMINALLLQALRERASDLHFEPYEGRSVVRFRVDGSLRDIIEPPRALHAALVSRLKIMANLDIAEKRLPQDGRIALRLGDKQVDVRMSTLPTGPGERVVLRLLDKDSAHLDLTALGMDEATRDVIDRLIREPHGIVLVTGPTGSGKTTTLYASLSRLPRGTVNMMTVEDPIEYALDGVAQTQVNPHIELDFARALRAILRQDPGRHHDRRNPRSRNGADRRAGVADRPPGAGHAAHERRHQRGDAPGRHGRRAVPAGLEPARRARTAAGAHAVSGVPGVACTDCGRVPAQRRPRASRRNSLCGLHLAARHAITPDIAGAPASTKCCRSTTRSAATFTTATVNWRCARRRAAVECARCARTAPAGSPTVRCRSPNCCA